jgi:hypothetical protein
MCHQAKQSLQVIAAIGFGIFRIFFTLTNVECFKAFRFLFYYENLSFLGISEQKTLLQND